MTHVNKQYCSVLHGIEQASEKSCMSLTDMITNDRMSKESIQTSSS